MADKPKLDPSSNPVLPEKLTDEEERVKLPHHDEAGEKKKGEDDWRVEANIGSVEGGADIAQTINKTVNINRAEGKERKRLQPEDFKRFSPEDLERENDEIIHPDLEPLIQRLRERRFLFLIGGPESGKATIARTLALRLGDGKTRGVLFYSSPVDRGTEISFQELAESPSYQGRLVIFKDAFAKKSIDLNRFASELNEAEAARYSRRLAENRSFLLFTSDADQIENRERLSSLGLLCELAPIPADLLVEGLQSKVEHLLSSRPEAEEHRAQIRSLLEAEGERIATKLGTMPRITRFVQELLLMVAKGSLSLDEALDRVDDLGPWFLKSLAEDFAAWSYVLALTLCHATAASSERVAWIDFDQLRQVLTRVLHRELRRKPGERNPSCLCGEEELRQVAAAEIDQASGGEACAIRFREKFYPVRLWKSLLGPGRQILGALMPALRDLLRSPVPSLRITAARALGRIAELDPYGLAMPLIWGPPGDDRQLRARILGQFLQGVLGSNASSYKALCLRELRATLSNHDLERTCTGILCLSEIGAADPSLAFQEIRRVLSTRLAPRFEDLGKIYRRVELIERAARNPADTTEALSALLRLQTGNIAPLLSDREQEILESVYITLTDLCLFYDDSAMALVDRLSEWSQKPDEPLAHLVTLVALSRDGLIDILNSFKVDMTRGNELEADEREGCSAILYWAWRLGGDATRRLGKFFENLYSRTSPFPGILRQALRKRWLSALKTWARQACSAVACRGTVIDLFDGLISAESPEVRQEVLHLLKFDPDFAKPGSDLEALAIEIITRTPAAPRLLAALAGD
ncbi:MAG: hypothetical protein JF614_01575 [Acidobacteria bacterium]|nr:hypothetical protein [Acidobacteriota bacterium]